MPKEYCFRYPNVEEGGDIEVGQEIEFGHGLVEDEGMFLADYSSGEKEIIAIECSLKELETGEWTEMARIRTFPAVNIFTGDTSGVLVDASEFPEAEEDFELEEDEALEMDIRDDDGDDVVLIVRHAEPDEITPSLLIPLGLRNPN